MRPPCWCSGWPRRLARARLYGATAGNPLALLELAPDAQLTWRSPRKVPPSWSRPRSPGPSCAGPGTLSDTTRQALVLAATSDSSDLTTLGRAAAHLGVDLSALAGAEAAGLVTLDSGRVEFRHPLARSAIYADAPAGQRRDAHRALAARPARPGRGPPRLASGRGGDRAGRGRVGRPGAGRGPQPRPQRVRDRRGRVRTGRAARRTTTSGAAGCCGKRRRRAGSPGSPTGRSRCWTRPARSPVTR